MKFKEQKGLCGTKLDIVKLIFWYNNNFQVPQSRTFAQGILQQFYETALGMWVKVSSRTALYVRSCFRGDVCCKVYMLIFILMFLFILTLVKMSFVCNNLLFCLLCLNLGLLIFSDRFAFELLWFSVFDLLCNRSTFLLVFSLLRSFVINSRGVLNMW